MPPELGDIALEFSAFAVDGRPDLAMMLYIPLSSADAARIRALADGIIAHHQGLQNREENVTLRGHGAEGGN